MKTTFHPLEDLLACQTPAELEAATKHHVRRLGFDWWVYLAMPGGRDAPPLFITLNNFPRQWVQRYFDRNYANIDPVIRHCKTRTTPFVWTSDGQTDHDIPGTVPFFHEAADHGLKTGISIPVHGLGCEWGLMSLVSSGDVKVDDALAQLGQAQLLASYIHEAGYRFALSPEQRKAEPPRLTARELECLRWSAEGKTGWEISRLLSISERTVVFHLENAAHKLGAFGRRQAVARAISLQLITL